MRYGTGLQTFMRRFDPGPRLQTLLLKSDLQFSKSDLHLVREPAEKLGLRVQMACAHRDRSRCAVEID
jgi:hypothetical protein